MTDTDKAPAIVSKPGKQTEDWRDRVDPLTAENAQRIGKLFGFVKGSLAYELRITDAEGEDR
jgi:hypothetical protein